MLQIIIAARSFLMMDIKNVLSWFPLNMGKAKLSKKQRESMGQYGTCIPQNREKFNFFFLQRTFGILETLLQAG